MNYASNIVKYPHSIFNHVYKMYMKLIPTLNTLLYNAV